MGNAYCENDMTDKEITPLGGFTHYGIVNQDFLMIKGQVVGTKKKAITIRKSLVPHTSTNATEEVEIKFIDTSSKIGHGKFQTDKEKSDYLGPLKRAIGREE